MKTKKNVIKKKLRRPGFEPIIYVSVAMLTNHKTTMGSTKKYIFSVSTVIIYSCIKVRIRLIW